MKSDSIDHIKSYASQLQYKTTRIAFVQFKLSLAVFLNKCFFLPPIQQLKKCIPEISGTALELKTVKGSFTNTNINIKWKKQKQNSSC